MEYLAGVMHVAIIFLSFVAGSIAFSLLHVSHRTAHLRPWKYLIFALMLFALEEVLGALISFRVIYATFLTHLIPSLIMVLIIFALNLHIHEHTTKRDKNAPN